MRTSKSSPLSRPHLPSRRVALGGALAAGITAATAGAALAKPPGLIDEEVDSTLQHFYRKVPSGYDLEGRSAGVLVFPQIVKAGFGIGGEYGEGALRIRGQTVGYFNSISASIGFQFGVQARSVIIMFMTPAALDSFRRTDGWKIGVDGSVALIAVGAGGSIDTVGVTQPVIGFILDQAGLMYNLTLEGSKISRIYP